jgi:choline kinase
MEALILAAGYGSRLSPATESTPKILLNINDGVTILDKHISALTDVGIKKLTIVTGFQENKIIEHIKHNQYPNQVEFNFVYNPFYRAYNNLISLWLGLKHVSGDFIMINGDNVYKPAILRSLIECQSDYVIPVSQKKIYDDDDVKVTIDNGMVTNLSKEFPERQPEAEWIGFAMVRGSALNEFRDVVEDKVKNEQLITGAPHYLSVFNQLAKNGVRIRPLLVPQNTHAEVDFQMDIEYVRSNITRFYD